MPREKWYLVQCPKCGREWQTPLVEEHGIFESVRDDDAYCNECGVEAEVVREIRESDVLSERAFDDYKLVS